MSGPLVGVRVLDIGTMIAGPFGATVLADFGAEVFKVELPGRGDALRDVGARHQGQALGWLVDGRNKKSITLDLRRPEGRDLLLRLIPLVDVAFENFTPGTLDRWGLDEATLRAANPRLILIRVSGYGQEGPYSQRPGYDRVAMAYGGVTYLTGTPDGPPVRPGVSAADYTAGLYGAVSALMALYHRDALQGQPQTVDISLFEGMFRMTRDLIAAYDATGKVRQRSGNFNPNVAPGEAFETRDGRWLAVVCAGQNTWESLARGIDRPDLITDPRFVTNQDRVANADALHALVREWFAEHDAAEVEARLSDAGVPVSAFYSAADIVVDEQYRARGAIAEVPHPALGTVRMPSIGPRFSQTPGEIRHAGPDLGEHNDEVYQGLLGLDAADLARLK
ncbi:MAG TPA: CoA transferase, partial [Dehalococcoidia bacterium]|nr:CoA transferase [Dehalococcoidia bacterium]